MHGPVLGPAEAKGRSEPDVEVMGGFREFLPGFGVELVSITRWKRRVLIVKVRPGFCGRVSVECRCDQLCVFTAVGRADR